MGELVGFIRLDGGVVDQTIPERWNASARVKPVHVRAERPWAVCSRTPQPVTLRSGTKLFVEARLDERDELRATLGLPPGTGDDAYLVAAAYDHWGQAAHERLYGDFSIALWNEGERTLTLARDAVGVRALFYYFDGRRVAFASALHHLLALPQVPRDLDELALADFMAGATSDSPQTLYRHIKRVPAGGIATFREGSCHTSSYWTLDSIRPVQLSCDQDYIGAGRGVLDRAVASRLPAEGRVGAMLSGGFDSTAVAATAARLLSPGGLTAFTRVAGAYNPYTRFDERALAGKVAALYPNMDWTVLDPLHQAPRDTDPAGEAAMMGMPCNGFPTSWFEPVHQRAAELGIRTLFSGGLGNATLSWSGNALCHEQIRQGRWLSAVRSVTRRARREGRSSVAALGREIGAAIEPAALARWRSQRRSGYTQWQQMTALSSDFLESLDYHAHAASAAHDMIRHIAQTGRQRRWGMLRNEDRTDRLAYLRGNLPHEMVDPFTDRRLVEFTLGTPEAQFQGEGRRRWLARRVLADRLPTEVLDQNGRGRQVGEWYHLGSVRREYTAAAVEQLARSPLASRVLDIRQLRALVDTWPKDADAARLTERQHRYILHYSVAIGGFLRWYEADHG